MKRHFFFFLLNSVLIAAQAQTSRQWGDWQTWGQQDNGTYLNPVIPADYSDLDCIRVGDDYYAISSTMQYSPGMTILHSRDLVNWEIAGNAVSDLSQISKAMTWQGMDRDGRGIWAGSIRYYDNRFYIYFGTPDEGFFMTSAPKAEGPWDSLIPILKESGWDDCSAIWDENGRAWFIGTRFADGYKTYIFQMAKNGRSINRNTARLVNEGYGREASKLIYHDGYYYIVFSEHRDGYGRYVLAKRSRTMSGTFNEEKQLLLPCTEANEPNQGGIIEGPDGKWYFLTHHGSGDWSGRIVSLLPVAWKDGWPMMGDLTAGEPGRMVWQAPMPALMEPILDCQRSDDFDSTALGPQWQWHYQPRKEKFSLSERPGWLRMYAYRPLADRLRRAGNTLTQRSFRSLYNEVTVQLDISNMADGQHAGLCHFADHSGQIGVLCDKGKVYLERASDDQPQRGTQYTGDCIWLRSTWGLDGHSYFSYSTDGIHFKAYGEYWLSWGFYRGDRIGIYNYNKVSDAGFIDVNYLHYDMQREAFELAALNADPSSVTLSVNQRIPIKFYAVSKVGRKREVTGNVTVGSSKPAIAAFEDGEVVGKSAGTALLYVSYKDATSGTSVGTRVSVTVTTNDAVYAPQTQSKSGKDDYYSLGGYRINPGDVRRDIVINQARKVVVK